MAFGLYAVGGLTALAGVLALIFGIRINEFSLGNTLIIAGTVGFVGGVLIAGLGMVEAVLRRIADDLAHMSMGVGARPVIEGLPPTPEATLRVGNISAPSAPPPFGGPQPDDTADVAPVAPPGGDRFPARRDMPPPPPPAFGAPKPAGNEKPEHGLGQRRVAGTAGLGAAAGGLARTDTADVSDMSPGRAVSPPPFARESARATRGDDIADRRKNFTPSRREEPDVPQVQSASPDDHTDKEADGLLPLSKLDTTMRPSSVTPPPPPPPRPDFTSPLVPPSEPSPDLAASTPPSPRSFFDSVWPRRGANKAEPPSMAADDEVSEGEGAADSALSETYPPDANEEAEASAHLMDENEPDEPDESDVAPVTILKSGVIDGMAYTLYSDGSIEAELSQGTVRFASVAELRDYIENAS